MNLCGSPIQAASGATVFLLQSEVDRTPRQAADSLNQTVPGAARMPIADRDRVGFELRRAPEALGQSRKHVDPAGRSG